jgi:uncharacterized protein DUF4160/uncharacterized protein DUF2442
MSTPIPRPRDLGGALARRRERRPRLAAATARSAQAGHGWGCRTRSAACVSEAKAIVILKDTRSLAHSRRPRHPPPHFHAMYAEHEALVDLRDFRIIAGSLPRRAMAFVLEWASEHRQELMEDWELCARMQPPKRIQPRAPWRIRAVHVIEHGLLDLEFNDGTRGTGDLRPFLASERAKGTVFEPLHDPAVFAQVTVHLGTIEWPGEIDVAPDVIYEAIKASGRWIMRG